MQEKDANYLDEAISIAEQSLKQGNYPVGSVLVINGERVASKGNSGETSKTSINHAETSLIIDCAEQMRDAASKGLKIELFSTLEPCLMCLGAAVMNKVDRIVYIQTDPHAGACHIDTSSLGLRYSEIWPEVVQKSDYSMVPVQLILQFLREQIDAGIRVDWSERMIKLFNTESSKYAH